MQNSLLHSTFKPKPPFFNNEPEESPIGFLKELKRYIAILNVEGQEMCCIIAQTLGKNCKSWFYVMQDTIEDWDDFEREFRDYYWNSAVQMQARRKVHFGKFYENSKTTRVQYVMNLMSLAKDVTVDFDEREFVKVISAHFDRNVRLALLGQRVATLKDLNEILQLYDDEDKKKPRVFEKNNFSGKRWERGDFPEKNVNNVNSNNFYSKRFAPNTGNDGNGPDLNYKSRNFDRQNGDRRGYNNNYQGNNNNKSSNEKPRFNNKSFEQGKKQVHVVEVHTEPDNVSDIEIEEQEHESENEC